MVWSKLNRFSTLLTEVAISCSLATTIALALEWLKPGLISNLLDLNLLLVATIGLVMVAVLQGSRQLLTGWTRWYYAGWTLLAGSLLLKVICRLMQWSGLWWLISTFVLALGLLWLLIITRSKKHD